MKKDVKYLIGILIKAFSILVILVIIQSQIVTLTKVYQWSMYNTLSEGDILITEKLKYRIKQPSRGDIIIFLTEKEEGIKGSRLGILFSDYLKILKGEEPHTRYVKRVIGIPGDIITIKEGFVFLNGEKLDEPYIIGKTEPGDLIQSIVVPEGYVFVLGDNREGSLDSRSFGCVSIASIESRVVYKVWPSINKIK